MAGKRCLYNPDSIKKNHVLISANPLADLKIGTWEEEILVEYKPLSRQLKNALRMRVTTTS